MDELEISGKRYISTRRAAREHGYHSDYMGQLIRGGKVAGQKVGRAWYIDEASLAAYLAGEQAPELATPAAAVIEEAKAEPVIERLVEEPIAAEVEPQKIEVQEIPAATPEPLPTPPPAPAPLPTPAPAPFVGDKEVREAPAEKIEIKKIYQELPIEEIGGLRYAADDTPSIPMVTRMPTQSQYYARPQSAPTYAYASHAPTYAEEPAGRSSFPYVSLAVVAALSLLVAGFASNFVSATIVSEPGKSAVVQYAIHW